MAFSLFSTRRWPSILRIMGFALGSGFAASLPLSGQVKDFTIFSKYRMMAPSLDEVDRLVSAKQFDQARERLKGCLAKIPDHHEANFYLALMAYEEKDYPSALACIERSKAALADLLQLYEKELSALDAAQERAQSALEDTFVLSDPGMGHYSCRDGYFFSLRTAIATVERRRGPWAGVQVPFVPPKEYHFLHGNCLFRMGRQADAQAQYRAAIQSDPLYEDAWNNLINSLWVDRQPGQALSVLHQAEAAKVRLNPRLRAAILAGRE